MDTKGKELSISALVITALGNSGKCCCFYEDTAAGDLYQSTVKLKHPPPGRAKVEVATVTWWT